MSVHIYQSTRREIPEKMNLQCFTHRVIQEKRPIFWEVIGSVIVRRKDKTNMCLILNCYRDRAAWKFRPNSVRFLFVWLDEERSLQNKVDTWEELLARILDAAVCIKRLQDQLRRTTRVIVAHELQSAMRLTVGLPKIYSEL
jgi:predicted P-loop ATPase